MKSKRFELNGMGVVAVSMLLSSAAWAQVGGGLQSPGGSGPAAQSAPWQNQAQSLQRQLSPATGDMALSGASMQAPGSGYGVGGGGSGGGFGSSLSGSMRGLGGGATGQPWMNQAQQLQRKLNGSGGGSGGGLAGAGGLGDSADLGGAPSLSSGAGAATPNPYARMPSSPGVGGAVPGASSPYTSTGNAAGNTPYRDPYALNQLETAGVK